MASPRFQLDRTDLRKLGRNLLIVCAGAGLTYLSEWVAATDFGQLTPVVVLAVSGLIDAARRYLQDNSP